jgi:hypothetical protein
MMASVLFGVMGLAIEVSGFYSLKRKMQTGADAGAKSGAIEIYKASGNWDVEARRGATQNGYTGGVDGATVTVNRPPAAGDHAGNSNYVEVIIQQVQNLHLIRVLSNAQTTTLRARAVGGPVSIPGASIVVLDPTAPSAFKISGGGILEVPGGIIVDSNNGTKALDLTGGSAVIAGFTNVTGGASGCGCTPMANTGTAPIPDPLAYLSPPTYNPAVCNYTNYKLQGGASATLNPGVYCGGITISSSQATFNPGNYILLGGGLTSSGGASALTGTGVSFYNTFDATHSFGDVNISGGGQVNLSAPSSGSMAGVLFFQDRAAPSNVTNIISGGSDLSMTGALYFKTQKLKWTGGSSGSGAWTMLVVNLLEMTGGNTRLGNDYDGTVPTPFVKPTLVE